MAIKTLNYKELTLKETLDTLLDGGVVIVKGVEATSKQDILVRLDQRTVPVTQISYDAKADEDSMYFKPYWVVYDIPFNFFVTRTVIKYTDDYRLYNPKFKIGDNVKYSYTDDAGNTGTDTAFVELILVDENETTGDKTYYYHLSRVNNNIVESKLTKI